MTLLGEPGAATTEQPALTAVRDECVAALGTDLVAYLLGAGSVSDLRTWRMGEALATRAGELRLRAAHAVLSQFKDTEHARAWLRRPNADLDGQPPASALRVATTWRGVVPVIEAAELPT
ncbi:antitoxin Xre/MbcA/ParS toxin-binding domain-containing protein [Virgisporangium ochraceum]|uniref:Antitoxin Xre/MbcA/ParS-like toxin-binding domain-containing protein n=1 Tax=Virgisporangium ochraceum TaxID=65505 RepID=A0A8J4A3C7_9ACTN|nr:antitoxin Xre/MbcA/ParS toxin-binding domain-containing protein [Virgisporangium ochraceum]GIJ72036.1 hypothetical protein Voc01_069530 [Virgisporangium ochraceum]